ncbi:MAG: hypothetical protein ACRD1O_02440, partial [Terriglobia bacterium]
ATAFERAGVRGAADIPDFASYLQPLLAVGSRPLVCVALSGAGADIQQLDETLEQLFPGDKALTEWLRLARRGPRFQGLPSRTYWLDAEQRVALAGRANELVSRGRLQAPVVMALDLASPAATALATAAAIAGQGEKHDAGMAAGLVTGLGVAAAGASWVAVNAGGPKGVAAIVVDGDLLTGKRIRCLLAGSA